MPVVVVMVMTLVVAVVVVAVMMVIVAVVIVVVMFVGAVVMVVVGAMMPSPKEVREPPKLTLSSRVNFVAIRWNDCFFFFIQKKIEIVKTFVICFDRDEALPICFNRERVPLIHFMCAKTPSNKFYFNYLTRAILWVFANLC